MSWTGFFKELMTPSDFKNDAYGELTNQLSHTLLGIALAVLGCGVYGATFGEMPVRLHVIGTVGLLYLAIESLQKWRAGDSGFDWFMVMCGAVMPLISLEEVAVPDVWYLVEVRANFASLLCVFFVWSVALAFRVKKRLKLRDFPNIP